jgi:tape measure domain-containing protein
MPGKLTYDKLVDKLLSSQVRKTFTEISSDIVNELAKVEAAFKRINTQAKSLGTDAKSLMEFERLKIENEKLKLSYDKLIKAKQEINQIAKVEQQLSNAIAREKAKQTQGNVALTAALQKEKQVTKELNIEKQKSLGIHKSTNGLIGGLINSVKGYIAAWLGITGVIRLVTNLFETTKKLDALRFTMRALITDQNELAETERFLLDISIRYGQQLLSLTDNYIRFRAALKAGNITVLEGQKIFESFTRVGAVLGKSAADMDLIFLAVEQMISKGVVTSEELRRQLGERIPGAVKIMANALGVTTNELQKMLKNAQIITEDVLPKFADEMERTFGTENIRNVNTLQAATGRLKTEWQSFVKELELSETFITVLNSLSISLNKIKQAFMTDNEKAIANTFTQAKEDAEKFASSLQRSNAKAIEDNNIQIDQYREYQKLLKENTSEYDEIQKAIDGLILSNAELIDLGRTLSKEEYFSAINEQIKLSQKELDELNKGFKDNHELLNSAEGQELKVNMLRAAYLKNYIDQLKLVKDFTDDGIESGEGYLEILREQKKELEKQREELQKTDTVKYYREINDLTSKIKSKQDEIDRILGKITEKGKTYSEALKEALGEIKLERDNWDEIYDVNKLINEALRLQKQLIKDNTDSLKDYDKEDEEKLREVINRRKRQEEDAINLLEDFGIRRNAIYQEDVANLDRALKSNKITIEEYDEAIKILNFKKNESIIDASEDLFNSLADAATEWFDFQVQQAEAQLNVHDEAISDLENRLNEEKKLKDQGIANDYDRLITQYADEKKLREQALEDLKRARKAQAAIELAQQTGSLITASAKIFAGTAHDPVTTILAIATIASMLASFIGFKAKIQAINEEQEFAEGGRVSMRKGGKLTGKKHSQGGIPITAEDGEYVIKSSSYKKAPKFTELLNKGKISDRDIMYWSAMNQIDLSHNQNDTDALLNELRRSGNATEKLVTLYEKDIKVAQMPNGDVMLISNGGLKREIYKKK